MTNGTVKGNRPSASGNTLFNAIDQIARNIIRETVNTGEIVRVDTADAQGTQSKGGKAVVTPLVTQTDAYDNTIPATALPPARFMRLQHGNAAVLIPPQPGDKGVTLAMKRDSSDVSGDRNEPSKPGSFRVFDQADSVMMPGVVEGVEPEVWLYLDPVSGQIELSTKSADLSISCRQSGDIHISTGSGRVTIKATEQVLVQCDDIVLDGDVRVTGDLVIEGESGGVDGGPARFRGGILNTEGVIRTNGVVVETHTHSGVQSGSGNTNIPNQG